MDATASTVYLELLQAENSSAALLAGRVGRDAGEVEAALDKLVAAGLVWQVGFRPSTYVALAPEVSVRQLIGRRATSSPSCRSRWTSSPPS